MVRLAAPKSMQQRLKAIDEEGKTGQDPIASKRRITLLALLSAVRDLQSKPHEESATFKRVQQARRHELWRVAHPFDPDVAVRLIIWFAPTGEVVVAVFSFDKARQGDVWYARAAAEGQLAVDQWLREHPEHGQRD